MGMGINLNRTCFYKFYCTIAAFLLNLTYWKKTKHFLEKLWHVLDIF